MNFKIKVCEKFEKEKGKFVPVNKKGEEEMEVTSIDINMLSVNKQMRLIGIGKSLYRLTEKSYKQIKKELLKIGSRVII